MPGAYSREKHLDSYLNDVKLKRSTRKVSTDDSTYDTVFQTRSGHALILRVHIPPGSKSNKAPSMTLVGVKASHPWLDSKMLVIGYPAIISDIQWTSSKILLGKAVNDVVKQFQLNPPTAIQITDQSLQRLQQQTNSQTKGSIHHPSLPPQHMGSPPPPNYEAALATGQVSEEVFHMPIPAVPSSFPELDKMSKSEMETLLNDDAAFLSHVEKMSAVTTINDLQESILKGNVDTAKSTLEKQEEIGTLHAEVEVLKKSLEDKVSVFQELEKKQADLCVGFDSKYVCKRLYSAKREAFSESENMASNWLDDNDDSVDEFVKKFIEKRIVYHARSAKIERLNVC
eukprot:CAMPEP_0195526188 /NCGR_PEP_ID=MMETSP0794_2-20130614/27096_1 /TAXON_ID=515487 /ORGANISM="Stephanopyxis turris, Strain CCMP 815" /LENGTH=341 /DNA_ID=CAMNT_0040656813 /DNA_START=118 /DNA_END=1143 /DNA_ORIENTATION=-